MWWIVDKLDNFMEWLFSWDTEEPYEQGEWVIPPTIDPPEGESQ